MKNRKTRLAGVLGASLLLAACGTSGSNSAAPPGAQGFTPPKLEALKALGQPEGQLNVLAWPGYAENGSNDPKVNWVTPFEQQTGCKVNVKPFGTSDEAVTLMKTGQYDVVSASGDASLRLVASGDAEPVNTALVPNYADVQPFLKDKSWNSVGGVSYGIPHGWGANLLTWRTDKVTPAPTSWSVMFDANSPYKGKVIAYDSPIYIADAALYLMAHQPDLGIKNPYALDDKQFTAAVNLLKQQRPLVSEYWSDYLKESQALKNADAVVGTAWQVTVNLTKGEGAPLEASVPSEGATGWSDTWMVAAKSAHKTCAYKWLDYIISPKVNAQVAEYFGEAPANTKACAEMTDKTLCDTYHASDAGYASKIAYWTTPIPQCLDGRTDVKCKDYGEWTKAWTEIKG
ncbi:Spermidine/putrescine import ABC transporter substrate-binding protein PotD (TC 3.A.1.11.1) [Amycolatopsis camponoti]|uniref:Spermidine/putrescine import ABC transporter substrate-binding protein PotD (TC 3.A.1.11.1) n=1 Tax=Amycolatopsis camponoti TaxID=2606593 RepID=A0A6I8M8U7_9PSEU|nr:ABC transporter substrate-binding protein [Amycolatopsis camponoti]VVJ25376.1 Spermidine/putrescine import ABC transporter substrate-binding protein PotD (TC 3.A.1.11.1) [Amycolatopsis camponoti]